MRTFLITISLAAISLMTFAFDASAETCEQRAAICVQRSANPATIPQCRDPQRMAQCRATGMYTAPSGKSWPAQVESAAGKKKS